MYIHYAILLLLFVLDPLHAYHLRHQENQLQAQEQQSEQGWLFIHYYHMCTRSSNRLAHIHLPEGELAKVDWTIFVYIYKLSQWPWAPDATGDLIVTERWFQSLACFLNHSG